MNFYSEDKRIKGIFCLCSSLIDSFVKAWFSYVGTIPDDGGFYCFPTVPDFAD